MLRHSISSTIRYFSSVEKIPRICIIGSGPAGWYTSKMLTDINKKLTVDIYEKLPIPFGLVRYGVAPDHPEVKNVEHEFTKLAKHPRLRFIGNVDVGNDILVSDLQKAYHGVIFAYGAPGDRQLGIPGEEHIIPAQAIVGWYNGAPEYSTVKLDLDCEQVAIIGQGNVALDISRLLLRNVDDLKKTDITKYAIEELSKSKIKRVTCIGRRGPYQTAFTIAEVREMVQLPDFDVVFRHEDLAPIIPKIPTMKRPKKRLMQLIIDAANNEQRINDKQWCVEFLRSPLEVTKTGKILNLKLGINTLEGEDEKAIAKSTGLSELREFGMVIRSVGYSAVQIDPRIQLDEKKGKIPNSFCRVNGKPGFYCSGWIQTGPIGVLVTTRNGCYDTAQVVNQDIVKNNKPFDEDRPGFDYIDKILKKKGVQIVSFVDWLKIDKIELEKGAKVGKIREKIVSISEMLQIARS